MTQLNVAMTHFSGDWLRLGHAFLTLWQGQADHCIALSPMWSSLYFHRLILEMDGSSRVVVAVVGSDEKIKTLDSCETLRVAISF